LKAVSQKSLNTEYANVVAGETKRGNSVANSFAGPKYQDFTVLDAEGHVVGHIRVKPSGISWRKADHGKWHRLKLNRFAELAIEHGDETDQ
jgi:hypothetical protein